jgi:hypothetical protein
MTAPLSFAALAGQPLVWTQPHAFTHEFVLSHGDAAIGTLAFRSAFGTFATAKNPAGCWTMKRVGFLKTRVEIRPCDSETAVGTFHTNTWIGGGTLMLPDGRELRADTNLWQSRYEFSNAAEQPLVRYTTAGFFKASGEMDITAAGAVMPELPWIAMLGWYLVIMMRAESTAAGAAVITG